jgi:hypothetical protein
MLTAAFVSFASFALLLTHMSPQTLRRIVGYKGYVDVILHGTILWMFFGTSTMGLLQAEAAGICFSLYLRFYSWAFGYERLNQHLSWVRYSGAFT